MQNLKEQKGITLIILVVTVVVFGILATTIYMRIDAGIEVKNYNNLCADIQLLESKLLLYYNKYGTTPTVGTAVTAPREISEPGTYLKIDTSKLEDVTLNYGTGEGTDYYIVNTASLNVYYLQGVEYDGAMYYTD